MNWDSLVADVTTLASTRSALTVSGVEYDSRKLRNGSIFVAIKGGVTDGNNFIEAAVAQGVAGIITDTTSVYDSVRQKHSHVGVALVKFGRRGLAEASSAFFRAPQRNLALTAITGTNGKTTTAFVLEQILQSAARRCLLIGTVEYHIAAEVRSSAHTTPESRDTFELFSEALAKGCSEAIMEMSSHALAQERVWGLPVDVAVFTNLTRDHLDYHGSMEAYASAKARIFSGVGAPPPRVAVINLDDLAGEQMVLEAKRSQVIRYSMVRSAEFRATDVRTAAEGTDFTMLTPSGEVAIQSPLTGRVNVYNLLAASAAAWARGLSLEEISDAARVLRQIPGRFQVVSPRQGEITVVVDYAHTEDALQNLMTAARELVRLRGGRVITVFGCGGDRDRSKRFSMGRVAGEGSDLAIVTSDNPRDEDPQTIIGEAVAGLLTTATAYLVEEDRGSAIELAIREAKRGDIVLLAGKGHEKVQIVRGQNLPFDDVKVAQAVLKDVPCD